MLDSLGNDSPSPRCTSAPPPGRSPASLPPPSRTLVRLDDLVQTHVNPVCHLAKDFCFWKKINSAHLSNCTRVPMLHEMATALKRNLFQGYLSDDEQVAQRQNNSTACHRKKEKRSSQLRCRLLSERVASQPNMADIHRHRSEKTMNPLLWTIRLLLISPHKCDLSGFILSLTQTVGLPCFSNIRPTNAITRSMVKCSNFRRAWWNINYLDALASQKEAFCHGWCVVAHQSTSLVVWVLSGFTWPGRHWITINESIRKLCGNVQLCTHAHSSPVPVLCICDTDSVWLTWPTALVQYTYQQPCLCLSKYWHSYRAAQMVL